MKETAPKPCIEPCWPVALAILAVVFLLIVRPGRIRVFPAWSPYVLGAVVLAPMAGVAMAAAKARWLRLERTITLLFFLKLEKITAATVEILDRFRHPGFSAFQGSAIRPDDAGAREKLAV